MMRARAHALLALAGIAGLLAQGVALADAGIDALGPRPAMTVAPYAPRADATPAAFRPDNVRVPYAPDAPRNALALTPGRPSFALDADAAAAASRSNEPTFQLFVEGEREGAPSGARSAEQRFARALGAQSSRPMLGFGGKALDTTPCMSLASIGTPFGPAYNPNGFCP